MQYRNTAMPCLKEEYNTVVKTSGIKELLLNFGLESKTHMYGNEFY